MIMIALIVILPPWVVSVTVPLVRIASGRIIFPLLVRIVTLAVVIIFPLIRKLIVIPVAVLTIRIRLSARIVVISSLVLLVVELPLLAAVVFTVASTFSEGL